MQEALQKIRETAELHSRWHLVGHLQTNKARKVAGPFAYVHSIDSLDLLRTVDEAAATRSGVAETVDSSGPCRRGHQVRRGEADLPALFEAAGRLQSAQVVGLMVLPPYAEDPEGARPWFIRLREIRDRLVAGGVPPEQLRELSMGMSHDFHVAVEEGATIVRVGTAIFGTHGADQPPGTSGPELQFRPGNGDTVHMKVTPLDLRQQKFKTVMRGYDRAEVESFLNETAEDYEQALRETDRLRDDLTRLQSSLDEHREGERNLRNTLLTAQKLADEIRNSAEAEGKRLVREAEGRSDLMISKAQARLDEVQREIDGLRLEAPRRGELAGVDHRDAAQLARVRARTGSEGARREDPAPPPAPDRGAAGCAGAGARRAEGRRSIAGSRMQGQAAAPHARIQKVTRAYPLWPFVLPMPLFIRSRPASR